MPKPDKDPFLNNAFSDIYQEQTLLTALLYAPEMIYEVMKVIAVNEVFQHEYNRAIYEAICEIYLAKDEVSEMALRFHMAKTGKKIVLDKANMSFKFDDMIPGNPEEIIAAAEGLVSLYKRQAAYRLTLLLNNDLTNDQVSDEELEKKVANLQQVLSMKAGQNAEKTSKQAARGAMAEIDRAYKLNKEGKISGVPTGLSKLDREIGGWQKDEMIVIAGRPGMMKTAFCLHSIYHSAKQGQPVGLFSMEMKSERLNFRMASMLTKIPYSRMNRGQISLEEYGMIQNALAEIEELPIYYYDDVEIKNVDKARLVAIDWARRYNIESLWFDYLQYCQTSEKISGNREAQVSAVSKAIKGINYELQIPVIALAQLSRETEKRGDPTPMLSDLRESGQIEADASTVIGLLNPEYYIREGKPMEDPERNGQPYPEHSYYLKLLKNRSGSTMRVEAFADPATNRFADTDIFSGANQMPIFKEEKPLAPLTNAALPKIGAAFNAYDDDNSGGLPF